MIRAICLNDDDHATSEFLVRAYGHEFNVGTVTRYNDAKEWREDITKHLNELQNKYQAEEDINNIQKWIFEPKQHEQFAAVMYEAVMTHIQNPYSKALATTLLTLKFVIYGLSTPLPLMIPGLVLSGFGMFYMIKKTRDRAYDNANGNENSAAYKELFDVMQNDDDNIYDQDLMQFEFNDDGGIVEYDLLTHQLHNYKDDEIPNDHQSAHIQDFGNNDFNIYDEDAQIFHQERTAIDDVYALCAIGISIIVLCCLTFIGSFVLGFITKKYVAARKEKQKCREVHDV